MGSKMLFILFTLTLDTHPWTLLYALAALALVMLLLILVDKPYRDEEGHEGMTHGDWQAALSQVLLLIIYYVSALCLWDQEAQIEQISDDELILLGGKTELSDGVAFQSAVAGVGVVFVQISAAAYAAHTSAAPEDGAAMANPPDDEEDTVTLENPMFADKTGEGKDPEDVGDPKHEWIESVIVLLRGCASPSFCDALKRIMRSHIQ